MRPSPQFLGALAAVLVAGVTGGAMLGKVPPMRQIGLTDMFPTAHGPSYAGMQFADGPAPPDQYAIVTPEGRFEIEELSDRGLYRAQRVAWDRAYPEPVYVDLAAAYQQVSYTQPDEPLDLAEPATIDDAPAAEEPAEVTREQPALASSGFRVIDVTAELAARRQAE